MNSLLQAKINKCIKFLIKKISSNSSYISEYLLPKCDKGFDGGDIGWGMAFSDVK